uniref:Transposase n=1 Tax=Meloidogyne javanica TaxID=6303 RepID=A0A915MWJ4_MELJA
MPELRKFDVFITDEGSNVSHLGGDTHHRCIAHILATISRHITQPYADHQTSDSVIAVQSAITDLHSFISDLRRITPISQALRGVLLLPIATRWLSILAMVRAFSAADKESFKEIVYKYSGNQYTERMERIFSKQNLFEAYIQIVSILMIEMIKLENAWRGEARGDDLIRAALAKSGLKAFNRKMSEIFIENKESLSIIRCAAYLDPAVCGILKKIQKAIRNVAKQNFPECLRPHVENVSPSLVTFGQNAMRTEIDFEMEQYETGSSTQTCKERTDKSSQATTKAKKVATQTMDSPIITKDAATQSSSGLTDVSMQCYLDNRAEISWKFQLMQQQNQKLQQEKSKLLSQKNSIAEATP